MYIKYTIQLNIIEQKIKLQFEVSIVVIAELKNSKTKAKERISSNNMTILSFAGITDIKVVMMFVFRIINTNNCNPNKSNAHDSK